MKIDYRASWNNLQYIFFSSLLPFLPSSLPSILVCSLKCSCSTAQTWEGCDVYDKLLVVNDGSGRIESSDSITFQGHWATGFVENPAHHTTGIIIWMNKGGKGIYKANR